MAALPMCSFRAATYHHGRSISVAPAAATARAAEGAWLWGVFRAGPRHAHEFVQYSNHPLFELRLQSSLLFRASILLHFLSLSLYVSLSLSLSLHLLAYIPFKKMKIQLHVES